MQIRQLINALEELAGATSDDTEVRIATQPSYPMQSNLSRAIALRAGRDGILRVYLLEAGQVYDDPYAPARIFQEGGLEEPEPTCENCERTNVTAAELKANEGICNTCQAEFVAYDERAARATTATQP